MSATATATNIGEVTQVIGPVLVVNFSGGALPAIYNAIRVEATTESGQTIRVAR